MALSVLPLLVLMVYVQLPLTISSYSDADRCGRPAIAPDETAALGGKAAIPNSWPWTVSIRLNGNHNCSGSIVHKHWVVTSARCLVDADPALLTVEAGRHCRDCSESSVQRREVEGIFLHPDYNNTIGDEHDVAMLRPTEPFLFNDQVSPICLPDSAMSDNATCFIAGWGSSGNASTERMQQALLPIVSTAICGDAEHYGGGSITENMLCGADSCENDFGGPLMCKETAGDASWRLHGVTSWGDACDKAGMPGVYTRVQRYTDWIVEVEKESS